MAYPPGAEIQQQYVDAMGPELGRIFYQLFIECGWLHAKWRQYVVLFGTNQARIDVLSRAAPRFSRLLDISLWEDVLLHIGRMTDDVIVGRRKTPTLTLRVLPKLVADAALKRSVRARLNVVLRRAAFARDWRNRRIAHRDLALVLAKGAPPLDDASRQHVREALEAMAALLNEVERFYCGNDGTAYEVDSGSDALNLLYVLRDGLEADVERREQLKAGKLRPDALGPPRPL